MAVHQRIIPPEYKPFTDQILLHMALLGLLPPTANQQCLDRAETTAREFDEWLAKQREEPALARVMRRLLEDESALVDFTWSPSDGCFIADISVGSMNVSEEEAQAMTEVQDG